MCTKLIDQACASTRFATEPRHWGTLLWDFPTARACMLRVLCNKSTSLFAAGEKKKGRGGGEQEEEYDDSWSSSSSYSSSSSSSEEEKEPQARSKEAEQAVRTLYQLDSALSYLEAAELKACIEADVAAKKAEVIALGRGEGGSAVYFSSEVLVPSGRAKEPVGCVREVQARLNSANVELLDFAVRIADMEADLRAVKAQEKRLHCEMAIYKRAMRTAKALDNAYTAAGGYAHGGVAAAAAAGAAGAAAAGEGGAGEGAAWPSPKRRRM